MVCDAASTELLLLSRCTQCWCKRVTWHSRPHGVCCNAFSIMSSYGSLALLGAAGQLRTVRS